MNEALHLFAFLVGHRKGFGHCEGLAVAAAEGVRGAKFILSHESLHTQSRLGSQAGTYNQPKKYTKNSSIQLIVSARSSCVHDKLNAKSAHFQLEFFLQMVPFRTVTIMNSHCITVSTIRSRVELMHALLALYRVDGAAGS